MIVERNSDLLANALSLNGSRWNFASVAKHSEVRTGKTGCIPKACAQTKNADVHNTVSVPVSGLRNVFRNAVLYRAQLVVEATKDIPVVV